MAESTSILETKKRMMFCNCLIGSWIGGHNYPASGNDYILQSTPTSFNHLSHDFTCLYNKSSNPDLSSDAYYGTEGSEYSFVNGGSDFLRVDFMDDPLGMSRLALAVLTVNNATTSYNGYRTINSYYVHTWKNMSINVSITSSSSQAVSLSITPSINEKSWQIYNYVSFNF